MQKYSKINPQVYVYDQEYGLYYLQSRYYDPEVGRFLNADTYPSTGQGLLGNNMFVYCNNNPVIFSDSCGMRCVIAGTHLNEGARKQYYETADEAAKAFAEEAYESAMYTHHEFGAEIFSCEINGVTMYSYSTPRIGTPHSVMVGYATPEGTQYVAFAHIHPNSNKFSPGDKKLAQKHNVNAYVAVPNKELQIFDLTILDKRPLGQINPTPLPDWQQDPLKRISWLTRSSHLNSGCHMFTNVNNNSSCNNKVWPAW